MHLKIKLIALDMDGTALLNDHRSITDRTRKAINQAAAQNILVVPTSGRIISVLPGQVMSLPGIRFAVTSNGSLAYRLPEAKVVYHNYIPPQNALGLLKDLPRNLWVEIWSRGKIYIEHGKMSHWSDYVLNPFHAQVIRKIGVESKSFLEGPAEPFGSIEKINLPVMSDDLKEKLRIRFLSYPEFAFMGTEHGFEIMNAGTSKASGLVGLCSYLQHRQGIHIQKDNIMAIGDSINDQGMLQCSGLGVAMGNAADCIKQTAGAVTSSNLENGAALAIEKYALKTGAPPEQK